MSMHSSSMLMSFLLALVLVAIAPTLQGCGGTPSPTPAPPNPSPTPAPPGPPGPSPSAITSASTANTTRSLCTGISLSGDSTATLSYDVSIPMVSTAALKALFAEHSDAYAPEVAQSIEAALDAADNFAGPAMQLMMSNLHAPLSNSSRDFLLALDSSDSLTHIVELKGSVTMKTSGSFIPRTYYPCIKVFQIDFKNGVNIMKSLVGLNAEDIFQCSGIGTLEKEERMSALLIA